MSNSVLRPYQPRLGNLPNDPLKRFFIAELPLIQRGIPGSAANALSPYAILPGETGITDQSFPVRNIRRYGAANNGSTNDLTAFTNAVLSLPLTGGAIDLDEGTPTLSGDPTPLWNAINARRSVVFMGRGGAVLRGNGFPPSPNPTTLYVRDLTDYVFMRSVGSVLESFMLRGFDVDGSNGTGTAGGSTTCPGLVANGGNVGYSYWFVDLGWHDFTYAHSSGTSGTSGRAIFDLDMSVFSIFQRCAGGYVENGRHFFTDHGSTTFFAQAVYLNAAREMYYHRNTTNVHYEDCVFESGVTVGAQYLTDVHMTRPYFENLGQTTGAAAWTTGLAPRNHGLVFGGGILTGNINTAINQLYGTLTIDTPTFQYLKPAGPYSAWLECLGALSASGNGGTLTIRDPRKSDAGLTDSLFASTMAYGTTERGTDFTVALNDAWGVTPIGAVMHKMDDARMLSDGRVRVEMNDGTTQLARVGRGRFLYDVQDAATSFTAAPSVWPRNGQNEVGDRLIYPTPVSGSFIGQVCTTAGQPGTWKTFGAIS